MSKLSLESTGKCSVTSIETIKSLLLFALVTLYVLTLQNVSVQDPLQANPDSTNQDRESDDDKKKGGNES